MPNLFQKQTDSPKMFSKLNYSKLMFGKSSSPNKLNDIQGNFMNRNDNSNSKNDLELRSSHSNGNKK